MTDEYRNSLVEDLYELEVNCNICIEELADDITEDCKKFYQQGRADEHEKVVQRISEILSLEIADCKNCPINCEVATYGSCQEELKKYLLEQIGAEE